jgi:uncharacterized membrane protein (DUF4010 family)
MLESATPASMPSVSMDTLYGLCVAFAIGLLIGIERERNKGEGADRGAAGVRTFILIALAGAVAERIGGASIAVGAAFVALAALAGYRRTQDNDPGLTTEVAMLVTFLLGVMAMRMLPLAAGLGAAAALVLASKSRLHRFTVHTLTEQEMHDALLLVASAVIVLPLLPDRAIAPWQALNPRKMWMLVVIVMAINAIGYIALRALGSSTGLSLAGFAGGFVSSTATIAAFGDRSRTTPQLLQSCVSAALFSNIATILQLAIVIGALSRPLLYDLALPLAAAVVAAVVAAMVARRRAFAASGYAYGPADEIARGRPFEPRHALTYVAVVSAILLASAIVHDWFGDAGLVAAAGLAGFADVHAAAASLAQFTLSGKIAVADAALPVLIAVLTNSVAKLAMAWLRGGRPYALRLLPGLLLIIVSFAVAMRLPLGLSSVLKQ